MELRLLLFAILISCMSLLSPLFFRYVLLPKKEGREIVGLFLFNDDVDSDDYADDD
jgi:hypothetical protein